VAIVIHLYAHGYNIMHPHDTRHCTELLPYDKAAMKLLRAVDMNRIPSELVGVLNEASPRQSWNGTITVEVRDYRADHLDMDNSRKRQALMPSVRRVRLHPTPESRLREIHALAKDYRPKGPTTWSEQEWVGLEGRVLPMVQAPLCLDPSVLVFCLNNVTHYNKSKYAPFNQDKYAVRLNQERAVQEKEEEIVVAGVVKTEHSRLVSFLTRGVRGRTAAAPKNEEGAAGEMEQSIPTPPTSGVVQLSALSADATLKLTAPPGECARNIEFMAHDGAGMHGSAFVQAHSASANLSTGRKYTRNIVEMRQVSAATDALLVLAPGLQHGPDFDERWQVCVRARDETPFTPELSYTFSSAADAHAACDELTKVFTLYEKRGLKYDAQWGGANQQLLHGTNGKDQMGATHTSALSSNSAAAAAAGRGGDVATKPYDATCVSVPGGSGGGGDAGEGGGGGGGGGGGSGGFDASFNAGILSDIVNGQLNAELNAQELRLIEETEGLDDPIDINNVLGFL
jgi:uncharacterized membrane protein YgcG